MGVIEEHLDPRMLSYLSPKARAELLAVQQVRFTEPLVHQIDRRGWGAIDWTLRPAEGSSVFVLGKRLPVPFGKRMLELGGNAILGDVNDALLVAEGGRDRSTSMKASLILLAGLMGSLLLTPMLSAISEGLTLIPLFIVFGSGGYFLWRAQHQKARARGRVHTRTFTLADPIAELIRIDALHPDPRNDLGALVSQAVVTPDLARHYARMASRIVEIHSNLDRYPIEVIGSIRNAIVTLTEALPQTARDCERAIVSLESVLNRLDKLDRANSELGTGVGALGAPTSDAALSDALRAIDQETRMTEDLLRQQRRTE